MPDIKIVFFDIDSTLYDQHKHIPDSTAEAITALQRKGIMAAVATGRAPFMFENLRTDLNIHSYVSFNGSYVVHQDEPFYKNPLPEDTLEILERTSSMRGYRMIFQSGSTMKIDGELNAEVKKGFTSLKLNLPFPEEDRDFYKKEDIYQALLFYKEQDDSGYLGQFPLNTLRYVRWHEEAVDVIPRNGSKARGIQKMLEKLGLRAEEACAFGDGNNDVEMLSYVGTGVAMGNAVDRAKQAADLVTRSVDDDGIYYGLKTLCLL